MRRNHIRLAVVTMASVLISSICVAQELQEVTVQGKRILNTITVSHSAMNPPILDVSLSYGVSTAGLDLGTQAGAAELEKRVRDAATAACEELGRKYSDATPNDADCIKVAMNEAMVRVRELEAAAAKKSTK